MKIKKGDWFKCMKSDVHGLITVGDVFECKTDGVLVKNNITVVINDYDSHKFKKLYTIQDLKDSKVAVDNRRSSYKSFSKLVGFLGHPLNGYFDYYYYRNHDNYFYPTDNAPQLPLQKVEDFLVQLHKIENVTESPYKEGTYMRWNGKGIEEVKAAFYEQEEEWEPKVGEMVEFKRFTSSTEWRVAEYLSTDKRCKYPYALTYTSRIGSKYILISPEIRQIPKVVIITRQEIADILGIELNQLEII